MTQSFAEKPELVRWGLMHGTRRRQRKHWPRRKRGVPIIGIDFIARSWPDREAIGSSSLGVFRILSVGAGDNTGGLQHVRLQLAQRKVTSRQGWR